MRIGIGRCSTGGHALRTILFTVSDTFAFANWRFNDSNGSVTDATYKVAGLKIYDVTDAVLVAQQVMAESSKVCEAAQSGEQGPERTRSG